METQKFGFFVYYSNRNSISTPVIITSSERIILLELQIYTYGQVAVVYDKASVADSISELADYTTDSVIVGGLPDVNWTQSARVLTNGKIVCLSIEIAQSVVISLRSYVI